MSYNRPFNMNDSFNKLYEDCSDVNIKDNIDEPNLNKEERIIRIVESNGNTCFDSNSYVVDNSESNKQKVLEKEQERKIEDIFGKNIEDKKTNNSFLNKKRKTGRKKDEEKKTKKDNDQNCHDKYSKDNLNRKTKHISIGACLNYINEKILDKIYINKYNSRKTSQYRLIKIDHSLIKNIKKDFNEELLEKNIKWIFTRDKCKKYKQYENNHNEILIENSLKDVTGELKEKLEQILNMAYLDYLNYYCGNINDYKDIFEGLITLDQYIESEDFKKEHPEDHEQYKENLKIYCCNYQNILKQTNGRNSKPKKKTTQNNQNSISFESKQN